MNNIEIEKVLVEANPKLALENVVKRYGHVLEISWDYDHVTIRSDEYFTEAPTVAEALRAFAIGCCKMHIDEV